MRQLEIACLRSPSPHHPHPNPHALRRYAHERQRGRELEAPYGLPHTALFGAFCRQVVHDFQLADRVEPLALEQIQLPGPGRGRGSAFLRLGLSDGSQLRARRLVIATGLGEPLLPPWVDRIAAAYPEEALLHSQAIDLAACHGLEGQHILLVGGGLTSAHLALGALRRGARVSLLCRGELRCRPFDADPGWLGPKQLKAFHREPCWQRRRQQVLAARGGGSITPQLAMALRQGRQRGRLQIHEHCEVREACWRASGWRLRCSDGSPLTADRIWLATGHRLGVTHQPLLRQLHRQRPIELVHDWPVLGHDLRWPGTDVHLMGALAALQLGPAARNLSGGREAAQRICRAAIKA
jgi:hypothetical protein